MEVKHWYDTSRDHMKIEVTLTGADLNEVELDEIDKAATRSPIAEPADILQSAEIIVRRLTQQRSKSDV